MRWVLMAMCVGCLALAPAGAAAVYTETFDNGLVEWKGFEGQPDVTTQEAVAKHGGALQVKYGLGKGMTSFGTPVGTPPAGARSIRFQLRATHELALLVALGKQNGSMYASLLHVRPNVWQDCQLSLQRFRVTKEHPDTDGHLLPEQITMMGFADVTAGMFGKLRTPGERTIWLDDLTLDSDEAPTAYTRTGQPPLTLDTFEHDWLPWLALESEQQYDTAAGTLAWKYAGAAPQPGQFCALLGGLGQLPGTGLTHLVVTLKSQRALQLAIVLQEEERGPLKECRYVKLLEVAATDDFRTIAVPLSELKLDTSNNGQDPTGKLDLTRVAALFFADVGVLGGQAPGPNTVWFKELQLIGE